MQALNAAPLSADAGAAAATLAQTAVAALQQHSPLHHSSPSADLNMGQTPLLRVHIEQSLFLMLQNAVAALVTPSVAPLVAVQLLVGRLLYSHAHLVG